jgi:hypothetical protein
VKQVNECVEHPAPVMKVLPVEAPESPPEDDVASVSTEDPVTLAMRATLSTSGDEFDEGEDDEQILFPQGTWSGLVPTKSIAWAIYSDTFVG